ncbi:hypothetical protein NIES4101_28190 (plasmid) [Calothrix sp. NIES-4101]|nr:hypothetical protein NIES4101_28190 [Calothrix sp. NIES-4101]
MSANFNFFWGRYTNPELLPKFTFKGFSFIENSIFFKDFVNLPEIRETHFL